ncbi:MAG: hypothetical protein JNK65_07260 [Deltaproteobacteria bacterium]|nr:hypothetical protein [Deltaproteobacteria bacterium]
MTSLLQEEYSQLEKGLLCFSLSDPVLRFQGEDVKSFLQGALSNDIKLLSDDRGMAALHLTAKGKWISALHLFQGKEGIWAHTSNLEKDLLFKNIQNLIFFSKSELVDLSQEYSWLFLVGEGLSSFFRKWNVTNLGPWFHGTLLDENLKLDFLIDPRWKYPAAWLLLPNKIKTDFLKQHAELILGSESILELARIESKIAQFGTDFDEKNLPQEVIRDEDYISYTKGCYIGQETVSRIKHYGKTNKRICFLEIENNESLTKGSIVLKNDSEIGKISSCILHPITQKTIALAMLPTLNLEESNQIFVKTEKDLLRVSSFI